jgi:hypothetical protein
MSTGGGKMDQITPNSGTEIWPIDRLTPYARNARRHSPEQIEQIAASMGEWGWTMPALADERGEIIAGHGRVMAGKLIYSRGGTIKNLTGEPLPFGTAPVLIARGWSEQQRRGYVIADNRLTDASDWDDEMLRLELNDLLKGGFELALRHLARRAIEAFGRHRRA